MHDGIRYLSVMHEPLCPYAAPPYHSSRLAHCSQTYRIYVLCPTTYADEPCCRLCFLCPVSFLILLNTVKLALLWALIMSYVYAPVDWTPWQLVAILHTIQLPKYGRCEAHTYPIHIWTRDGSWTISYGALDSSERGWGSLHTHITYHITS